MVTLRHRRVRLPQQTPLTFRLAAFRRSLGISQADAAAQADHDEKTWARWEIGLNIPDVKHWTNLAKGLGFDRFDDFMLEYAKFYIEHPEITSRGLRGSKPKDQDPVVYRAAPGLRRTLSEMLEVDFESVQVEDWRRQLQTQQAGLLVRVGQLVQDIHSFLWIFAKMRKNRRDG